jgi:hypothetical protein
MHVIFLAPHFPAGQRRFVTGLKNVGARVTGICDAPLERLDDETKSLLDGYEYVPTVGDEEAVYHAVRPDPGARAVGPPLRGDDREPHAQLRARARAHGIPGLLYEVVERCRDKFLMKNYLRERGIPCARNAAISSASEARQFVQEVGYPVILKPRGGAGAHDTYRLDDARQLAAAIAETGLEQGGRSFVMEEFITGHEGFYDTLTVRWEGRLRSGQPLLPERARGDADPRGLADDRHDESARRVRLQGAQGLRQEGPRADGHHDVAHAHGVVLRSEGPRVQRDRRASAGRELLGRLLLGAQPRSLHGVGARGLLGRHVGSRRRRASGRRAPRDPPDEGRSRAGLPRASTRCSAATATTS